MPTARPTGTMTATDLQDICHHVYEQAVAHDWQWRFDGVLRRPSYEDVEMLLIRIIDEVRKSPTSVSIETGGILVKRSDAHIDIYTHSGSLK